MDCGYIIGTTSATTTLRGRLSQHYTQNHCCVSDTKCINAAMSCETIIKEIKKGQQHNKIGQRTYQTYTHSLLMKKGSKNTNSYGAHTWGSK